MHGLPWQMAASIVMRESNCAFDMTTTLHQPFSAASAKPGTGQKQRNGHPENLCELAVSKTNTEYQLLEADSVKATWAKGSCVGQIHHPAGSAVGLNWNPIRITH